MITRLEEEWGLNPGPLTLDPDFLRIGHLTVCFPFASSSHTVSAVLMASGGTCGDRPQVCCSQYCWPGETWVGPETEKPNRENLTPYTCLPISLARRQPSLSDCLWVEPPSLLASYLSV